MPSRHSPLGQPTHSVENQPPLLEELNLYETDRALKTVAPEGAGWAAADLRGGTR